MELGIVKQELNVKDAWEIGPNDIDAMGLLPDDDFIIPDSVKDPPVLELMKLHGFKTDLHVDKKERARERKKRQKALKKLTGKKKGRKE